MRKIVLTDSQAARVCDVIRAGNPGFHVPELNRRTTASLRTKGLVTGTFPKLTEDGKDVARQLKAHPRRRTFYVEDRTPSKILRVQTASRIDNLTDDGQELTQLPYPLFVDESGMVGRQDLWNGRILRVVGFQRDLAVQQVDLWWAEAYADPQRAVGMYVVATDKNGGMFNLDTAVGTITEEG